MKLFEPMSGSVPHIIQNTDDLYEGNLTSYFRALFDEAQNVERPYHNFRHMLHVTTMCYFACAHHRGELTRREMRNILIAAMFHDFDHSGMMGSDDLNIARAIRGLDKYLTAEDRPHRDAIAAIIQATEYPYQTSSSELDLSAHIIRDADMSQLFSAAWIQQIVFGFANEWGKPPLEVLKGQVPFVKSLTFYSGWGQSTFTKEVIDEKIAEVEGLLALLEDKKQAAA